MVVVPGRGEQGEEVVICENEGLFLMGWVLEGDKGLACVRVCEGRVDAAGEGVGASLTGEEMALCEEGGWDTLS